MNLYIVSTPIGNLEDITYRAVRTLNEVDFVCAEDTRTSKRLMDKYEISTPLTSFHAHSSDGKRAAIVRRIIDGESAALISDAGTPGISDPGWTLIRDCLDADINVVPIPGASAVLSGLVGSGLPMDKFLYLGFLPLKKGRQTLFTSLADVKKTIIFYESPKRILRTLRQMSEYLPERTRVVIGRELTKLHEEFIRGTFREVIDILEAKPSIKGEIVAMVKHDGSAK
ncbi:MAG: 16S rRNA (cytidine(1402)-2'-O)-methyltransferase [Candidatus Gracilibacteria bacterium]|nr:16S rRNA (cytidine(1402)-2'-O)-methyltransferase [Candidatus Gracilibacteria bacterium]